MSTLVVLGAGGHGKVVADILIASGEVVDGFVDDKSPQGSLVLGLPVLGTMEWLRAHPRRVALGIGDNAARARLAKVCIDIGCELIAAVHPRAVIARSARIDAGAAVMAAAVVNPSAIIHTGVIVNTGAIVEHDCVLEPFSHLSPNATLGGGCRVGELAHVGIGSTMLPLTSVGPRSIVGGGALVSSDLPGDIIAVGVPARITRRIDPV